MRMHGKHSRIGNLRAHRVLPSDTRPFTFPVPVEIGNAIVPLGGLVPKRILDIALSGFLLILTFPLVAIAAMVIKMESGDPAVFCQLRTGRGFKTFRLFKLRTMRCCFTGSAYTLGADPRITRAGRWLRRFKIDELPQLWNVLRGDMSMVGPRPVIPELTEEFHGSYERLLTVRPGLTDPATLKYCREAEMLALVPDPLRHFKTVVTPDKLRISNAYLENSNVWSDLVVLLDTAMALLPSTLMETGLEARERGMRPRPVKLAATAE